ncbi:relaxase domain-containing protein [Klebsiella pneumoniae]
MDKALFTETVKGKLPNARSLTEAGTGASKHPPGYDLLFSAPKSVSVTGDAGRR